MPSENINEPQLLHDLHSGSAEAFEKIFRQHWRRLYEMARAKRFTDVEAQDALQFIFTGLWEKRFHLQISDLRAYLDAALKASLIEIIRLRMDECEYPECCRSLLTNDTSGTRLPVPSQAPDVTGSPVGIFLRLVVEKKGSSI